MDINKKVNRISKVLKNMFPDVKTALRHESPFQLLVATILSAQCTDKQVNRVTRELFREYKTPEDFAQASPDELEKRIRPTGFYKNKAKSIRESARAILEKHGGKVPRSLEKLVALPGVGRKTANVVRGAAFGIPAMVVDTHVGRISGRLGLTDKTDPVKIEFELMEIIPEDYWNDFSLHLIFFGRNICSAKKPLCGSCPLFDICEFPDKGKYT